MGRSNLVEQVRELTDITCEALARKLGVAASEVAAWQRGAAIPPEPRAQLKAFLAYARAPRAAGTPRKAAPQVEPGVFRGDGVAFVAKLPESSIDLILSDIPYGIGHDDWDVLHDNQNAAYLGASAAQQQAGKVFARRRKPINGWSAADREIPRAYQDWCSTWAPSWLRALKPGGSAIVFAGRRMAHRCVCAMEDAGFNYRDMIGWQRPRAVFRAQRLSTVFRKRGELGEAAHWAGWRLGNLRPTFEPILWLFRPYDVTIADNVLDHGVGAFNLDAFARLVDGPDNLIRAGFRPGEAGHHDAQKPVELLRALIELVCPPDAVVLDPFAGSGSTGVAAVEAGRAYVLVERDPALVRTAKQRIAAVRTNTSA